MMDAIRLVLVEKRKVVFVAAPLIIAVLAGLVLYAFTRPPEPLRILWVDWPPADTLAEVARAFTAETGIPIEMAGASWDDFQTVAYRDLDRTNPEYNIIIGDSQWLGRNVERGERYVDLTSFVEHQALHDRFAPTLLHSFREPPHGSGRYYAMPLFGDGFGFAYRKDLFENEHERSAFRERFGHELAVPETWHELLDIAAFFYRPEQGMYGISMPTSVGYDALTMTFESIFFSFGGEWGDQKALKADGYVNDERGVAALEFFKRLYTYSSQAATGNGGYEVPANDFVSGDVALAFNFFSTFYPLFDTTRSTHEFGFFAVPRGSGGARFTALGGQGASIVYHSHNKRAAKKFLAWWLREDTQRAWAKASGLTLETHVLESDEFLNTVPYAAAFSETLGILKDFWVAPEYPELLDASQHVLHDHLTSKIETAEEALDILAHTWDRIFETSPYNILRE